MKIVDILYLSSISYNASVNNKEELLRLAGNLLGKNVPDIDEGVINGCLLNREKLGNTGIGNGVAIPHGKLSGITVPIGCFIKLTNPIDFGANDGEPVDLCFGLLMPEDNITQHLEILSTLTDKFGASGFCDKLRLAKSKDELYKLVVS
jgi:PTS system nitrogen regulatory IIA component